MTLINIRLILILLILAVGYSSADAQFPTHRQNDEISQSMKEVLAKGEIKRKKEDFEELVARTEQAVKISEEIERSFSHKQQISSVDKKKLKELEKLIKKIRDELGADGDEVDEEIPNSKKSVVEKLKDASLNLLDEVKQTTRYTISAAAIETSNSILSFVKFLRGK